MSVDLLYSQVEDDLRSTVRDLLADRCPPATVLERSDSDQLYDLGVWSVLARDLGLAGLLVPESLGGQGASAREVAVVAEELGSGVAPVPFLGSAVLATSALLGCDTEDSAVGELLRALAGGESTAALVVPLTMSAAGEFPSAVKASGGKLTGTVTAVADAAAADTLVVPALGEDGPALYAVHARDVTVTNEIPLDLTRGIATVELSDVDGHVLAERNRAVAALRTALRTGAGILASEQLGLAQWCLDTTVRYLKERHQFGRPVGSFQALKHRLADVYLELVTARAAARYAADELARAGSDVAVAVALAASYCGQVAVHAAEEALQMHGGIGMTWEHPVHLYLKRAKSDQLALGTPGGHRAELAELVDLPA